MSSEKGSVPPWHLRLCLPLCHNHTNAAVVVLLMFPRGMEMGSFLLELSLPAEPRDPLEEGDQPQACLRSMLSGLEHEGRPSTLQFHLGTGQSWEPLLLVL